MKRLFYMLLSLLFVAGMFVLALPTLVSQAGLHPRYSGETYELPGKRALVITTSHAVLAAPGDTDGPATGVFASEMTHPYYTFLDGGMHVDIASVAGGPIPIDPQSFFFAVRSPEDKRYLADPVALDKVERSLAIGDVDIGSYDIVFIAGGWGAAYDLAQSPILAEKVTEAYYGEKAAVIGGVCHGVLGLVRARNRSGELLVAGRRMTGVTDKQVRELNIEITPLHPETELRRAGARFESGTAFRDAFATHVVVDDERRFVTGQNQNSGLQTAHEMMRILSERGG